MVNIQENEGGERDELKTNFKVSQTCKEERKEEGKKKKPWHTHTLNTHTHTATVGFFFFFLFLKG